ncbi:hypothetical protein CDA63_11855 [Hymenobacter amundsenii]|uniref:Uncharacterized protein n=1 Tax=Hymenobacter amundsenii TaxID=2006685 RepID=A0A246FK02_9BACT|nr:hypothetical protein [Hymenobacter amundsenii]OWP62906.1 hypothetical protein CDA63_11855 [Hymenobacter amundsenii]
MIRSAKLFETAGHQLLICIAAFDCPCTKPTCPGSVLGIRLQTVGQFPKGEALVQADCELPIDISACAIIIETLQQRHARELLEIVQSTGYGMRIDNEARQAILAVLKKAALEQV